MSVLDVTYINYYPIIDLSNYSYARHFKFIKETRMILPAQNLSNLCEDTIESNYKMNRDNIFQNQKPSELRH